MLLSDRDISLVSNSSVSLKKNSYFKPEKLLIERTNSKEPDTNFEYLLDFEF